MKEEEDADGEDAKSAERVQIDGNQNVEVFFEYVWR